MEILEVINNYPNLSFLHDHCHIRVFLVQSFLTPSLCSVNYATDKLLNISPIFQIIFLNLHKSFAILNGDRPSEGLDIINAILGRQLLLVTDDVALDCGLSLLDNSNHLPNGYLSFMFLSAS